MKRKSVQEAGSTRFGMQHDALTAGKHLAPCRLIGRSQIDKVPLIRRNRLKRLPVHRPYDLVRSLPNHQGRGVVVGMRQRQTQQKPLKLLLHAPPLWPDRVQSVYMRCITLVTKPVRRGIFVVPDPGITRQDCRNLCPVQFKFAKIQISSDEFNCLPRQGFGCSNPAETVIVKGVHPNKPGATAAPPIQKRRIFKTGQRPLPDLKQPIQNRRLRRKPQPAEILKSGETHPISAFLSILSAISVINAAKARFSGFGFIACASRTPNGVVTMVMATMIRKAGRLT